MKYFDLHVHTEFCDGHATAEEMVRAAIDLGCPRIGFSTHAPLEYRDYAMLPEREDEYRAHIAALKEKYRDRIEVLCGLEVDLYSLPVTKPYDYIIGSCHSFPMIDKDGRRCDVDESYERLSYAIDTYYGGDAYKAVEDYYASVATIGKLKPSIIGHFDLIRKYNKGAVFFDETSPRYLAAARAAIDALLPLGVPFEVNTGAIARGHREAPYPAAPLLAYILRRGGKVILTGDAHRPENLCYQFEKWEAYIRMFR